MIPGVICRTHEYTELFMSSNEEVKDDFIVKLDQNLQSLARKVLEFEALTLCYLDRSSVVKAVRDIIKLDPWETLIQQINDAEAEVKKFGDILNSKTVVAIKTATEARDILEQKTKDEEIKDSFLEAIYTCNYRERKDRNRERVPGTCEWFTNHRIFRSWIESAEPPPLWVSADPGCGKSVLSRHLVDNVILSSSKRTVCYFFFKDDFHDQKTSSGALASLLRQVFQAQPDIIPESALKQFKRDRKKMFDSFSDLWNILMEVCADPKSADIVFIIDALDECRDGDRTELMRAFISLYSSQHIGHNLRVLITSRPYEHIRSAFRELADQFPESARNTNWCELGNDPLETSMIHLSGDGEQEMTEISAEIDLVIEDRIHQIARAKRLTPRELKLFQDHIEKKDTQRTYLWISLVMDIIENTTWVNGGKARQTLLHLPSTVNEAYEKILGRSSDSDTARRILHVVIAAEEPFCLKELTLALVRIKPNQSDEEIEDAMEPPERSKHTFKDICGHLLTIIDDKVYLLHQTVKEFLVRPPSLSMQTSTSKVWHHSLVATESHGLLAEVCMHVLTMRRSHYHCLDSYSRMHWASHVSKSNCLKYGYIANLAQGLCIQHSDRFQEVSRRARQHGARRIPDSRTWEENPLSLACFHGLTEVALQMLDSEIDLKVRSHGRRSLVSLAAEKGLDAVVRLLVLRGADFKSRDVFYLTPLCYAARMGHEGIVDLLLECGAEVDPNVIASAAGAGLDSLTKRLIALGPTVDLIAPLISAAGHGHVTTLKLLQQSGADIRNFKHQCRPQAACEQQTASRPRGKCRPQTALHAAAKSGRVAAVKFLLQSGADVKDLNYAGRTALMSAASWNRVSVVKLLLQSGADMKAMDTDGYTALSWAAQEGCVDVTEFLLKSGADVKYVDYQGRTALSLAKWRNNVDVIRVLLQYGADINQVDIKETEAYLWTSMKARLLIEDGRTQAGLEDKEGRVSPS